MNLLSGIAIFILFAILAGCVVLFLSAITRFNRNPKSWRLWKKSYSHVGHRHNR